MLLKPAWMKTSGNMRGGTIKSEYYSVCKLAILHLKTLYTSNNKLTDANYLLKALQSYKANGIIAYSISIQNEPQNDNPT